MEVSRNSIRITGVTGMGTLRFKSAVRPESTGGILEPKGGDLYEVKVKPGTTVSIKYKSIP
jgi:hypothetical protein